MPRAHIHLCPDPGYVPTRTAPKRGEKIVIRVLGFPPFKELRASLRNPCHRHYSRFVGLRKAATKVMRGRKWSDGPILLRFSMFAPSFEKGKTLNDYLAGVLDTLDGSHGFHFTYLPIVFQDDCQVCKAATHFRVNSIAEYLLEVEFLD